MANMGIGLLGSPSIIIKRKFRYLLEWTTPSGRTVSRQFVKVASRPQLDIDETELHFLNAITWIPGKGRWQPLSVTYYDVTHSSMEPLYEWILGVYDFNKAVGGAGGGSGTGGSGDLPQSEKSGWAGSGTLEMLDGCGKTIETWIFQDVFPQSINFGDVDYGASDECTIDITFRFSKAKLEGSDCMRIPEGECKGC